MTCEKLTVTLITGRTIDQGVGKERGKASQEYFESAAVCFMHRVDIEKLGLRGDGKVKVTSKYGSVVVKATEYPRGSVPGMIFMPCGSWANVVCGDETYSMGMPLFKGFQVEIEPTTEPVLHLGELLKKEYGR